MTENSVWKNIFGGKPYVFPYTFFRLGRNASALQGLSRYVLCLKCGSKNWFFHCYSLYDLFFRGYLGKKKEAPTGIREEKSWVFH